MTPSAFSAESPRALIVVEPFFTREHVGVRRVIVDYWERLITLGFEVHLAVVQNGRLALVSAEATAATRTDISRRSSGMTKPAWSSVGRDGPAAARLAGATGAAASGAATSVAAASSIAAASVAATPPADLDRHCIGWV